MSVIGITGIPVNKTWFLSLSSNSRVVTYVNKQLQFRMTTVIRSGERRSGIWATSWRMSWNWSLGTENSTCKKTSMKGFIVCLEKWSVCEMHVGVWFCVWIRVLVYVCWLWWEIKPCEGLCLGCEHSRIKTFRIELPNWGVLNGLPLCQRIRYLSMYVTRAYWTPPGWFLLT